jgi:hypothetical protein
VLSPERSGGGEPDSGQRQGGEGEMKGGGPPRMSGEAHDNPEGAPYAEQAEGGRGDAQQAAVRVNGRQHDCGKGWDGKDAECSVGNPKMKGAADHHQRRDRGGSQCRQSEPGARRCVALAGVSLSRTNGNEALLPTHLSLLD